MHQPECLEAPLSRAAFYEQIIMLDSPPAVRLSTESEPCSSSSSRPPAASEDQSATLNDRYSCIMYSGYLLRFAELTPRPAPRLCSTAQKTDPGEQRRSVQKTLRMLRSIGTEGAEISFLQPGE